MSEIKITVSLTEEERQALFRFYETCEDDQDYDVPLPMMRRLARIGLVRRSRANVYEFTSIGISIVHPVEETKPEVTPVLFLSEQQLIHVYEQRSSYVPFRRVAEGNFQLPLYRHPVDKVYLVRGFYDYTGSTVLKVFLDKVEAVKAKDGLLAHLAIRPEFNATCTDEEYETWKSDNDKWIENCPLQGIDCDHYDVEEMELS